MTSRLNPSEDPEEVDGHVDARVPRRGFSLPHGRNVEREAVRGYYLDFSEKAPSPDWPPPWFPWPGFHRFMAIAQFGLGAYERYLTSDGERWLTATIAAASHLVDEQVPEGKLRGGWAEPNDYPQTFYVHGPWLSAMAQGQCASLLVRGYRETNDNRFADAARLALVPMRILTAKGGVQAELDGQAFPEEYPTDPASFVLNGAVFAFWGYFDVWRGLGERSAGLAFSDGVSTLAKNLGRWDTGHWSRYDLYPHPVVNVASRAYHALHIRQLRALNELAPTPELEFFANRFETYQASRTCRYRAYLQKAAFRLLVPRNAVLARRLPWVRRR